MLYAHARKVIGHAVQSSQITGQVYNKQIMAKYKLTYFPFAARAELCRFIFAQAGVEYEDIRIPFEKWPELKPS